MYDNQKIVWKEQPNNYNFRLQFLCPQVKILTRLRQNLSDVRVLSPIMLL